MLYPIGWDAFGLPTENYAIKTGIAPQVATKQNADTFRKQLKSLGFSFDWSREINTADPNYYKWTQWMFLKFFERGLAYKTAMLINWCPRDKCGLANEEVVGGKCERCGAPVEKRNKAQWMIKITAYADKLLEGLKDVDYLPEIKAQQENWIGRSEGAEIEFTVKGASEKIKVFTTRPDTLFGATYMVLAPEHPLLTNLESRTSPNNHLVGRVKNLEEVKKYIKKAAARTEMERTGEDKDASTGSALAKTGVELKDIKAINPANQEEIPIFVADYVMASYGTGAIMAVPAHDERDFAFAKKYNIEIREVIEPLVTREIGEDAFIKNQPISERKAVVAIIKHWSEDKYLGVEWKKTGWRGFVIGGIEGDEDAKTAGLREITEETGYKNVEFIKHLPGIIHARFFQRVKNQNRLAHFEPLLFKLKNGEMVEIAEEEKALHEFKWLNRSEFEKFITHADMQIIWQRVKGNFYYTSDGDILLGCSNSGILVNSGKFNGLGIEEAKKKITDFVHGKTAVKYKLRDWVFSRQRYWGEPIPIIDCKKCGYVAVPEKDLPVKLPLVKNYKPRDDGESPLASVAKWVNVKCPKCKSPAKRETDTMPNWAGSSWYFLRYIGSKNKKAFADPKKLKYFMPVDWYNGGMEHVTLHLLYSRFWNRFLYDLGLVPVAEPYKKRTAHGIILAEGGVKMSKSKGNVVNPDPIVKEFGADALRLYEMFMGPFNQAIAWDRRGILGTYRFLERVWRIYTATSDNKRRVTSNTEEQKNLELRKLLHKTVKKVSEDIESMSFNTAISAMMIFINEAEKPTNVFASQDKELFLKILAPFAPHVAEELWQTMNNKSGIINKGKKKAHNSKFVIHNSIHLQPWPKYDPKLIKDETFTLVVQINGKVRDSFEVSKSITQKEAEKSALKRDGIKKHLNGQEPKRIVFVPGRLINIVI